MMNNIKIGGKSIEMNDAGMYSANDLHKLTATDEHPNGLPAKKPALFLANDRTKRLILLIQSKVGFPPFESRPGRGESGTFMIKELLVAYGSWISPEIDLQCMEAFIEKVEAKPMTQLEMMQAVIGKQIEAEKQLAQIPILQDEVKALKEKSDHNIHIFHLGEYTSIKAFTGAYGLRMDLDELAGIGKRCSKHCRLSGIEIKKYPCPVFGQTNGYPEDVIRQVLEEEGKL